MKEHLIMLGAVFSCLVVLTIAEPVSGHRINVFAWLEGHTVHTESFFSDGEKAVNAKIEVFGPDDALLLRGTTDKEGIFLFDTPVVADLRIVLNDSMGHRAEYHLSASEFGSETDNPKTGTKEDNKVHTGSKDVRNEKDDQALVHVHGRDHYHAALPAEIKVVMAQVLDEKLSPVRAKLASLDQKSPSLSEILGGLGYIIGLMGTALYFKSRQKA